MTGRAGERPAPNRRTPTENGSSPRPCRTTNPQNPNNPPSPQESDTRSPGTVPPEPMDRIGERKPKTNPVRACAGPHPATSHSITTKPQNPNNPPSPQEPDTRPPSTVPPEPMDRIGNRTTKSGPVHTGTDHDTHCRPQSHHKPAEYQQSERTTIINHHQTNHSEHPNHGSNRRT